MDFSKYRPLANLFPNETVTHSRLSEIQLPGAGTFALVTLDNDLTGRPTTLGPNTLIELGSLLNQLRERAAAGGIAGVGIIGKPDYLAAGADLSVIRSLKDPEMCRDMARLGHDVFGALESLCVPTFAFVNGVALGGGLELALAATYRTVSAAARSIGLPEAFIGLVPGWGGVYRLPRLIGPGNAVKVMIENPLNNNRMLDGKAALAAGIADAMFEPSNFLEDSLGWATKILAGECAAIDRVIARRMENASYTDAEWHAAVAKGRAFVEAKTSNAAPAPGRLLSLLEKGKCLTQEESADTEVESLAELMQTPQFRDTVYAFLDLVQGRSKRPAGAPEAKLARPIMKVGVVGAGLMASQLAMTFARRLKVPVVMTDIDQTRVDNGVAYVHAEVDRLLSKERISGEAARRTKELVTGSVSKECFLDADFVIEAVFEDLSVKKTVFAELENVVSPECVLATNTSSLSVTEMAADLRHPGRVVGFHFFNPVAAMPLLEIVRAPDTSDTVLATAFALSRSLGKTAVLVQDSTAFVVNRILLRLMGEVITAFDDGTPAETADNALKPMGLPMTPFQLLAMVGLPVAQHVTESLHAAFGDRFRVSANQQTLINNGIKSLWAKNADGTESVPESVLGLLRFGNSPSTSEELLVRVQDALALEIGLMLDEGVVAAPEDIDLCMIMGAGWPMHLGGITPYLDRVGASKRTNGRTFHSAS
jgi:3-hydroxyacyl-CoA dehydrogenase/enoyl-CoA hydratase/carnithine racemase